jgi:hypothetical protein
VNSRVEKLLGLDYDGFLRTVVLPQDASSSSSRPPSERNSLKDLPWTNSERPPMLKRSGPTAYGAQRADEPREDARGPGPQAKPPDHDRDRSSYRAAEEAYRAADMNGPPGLRRDSQTQVAHRPSPPG